MPAAFMTGHHLSISRRLVCPQPGRVLLDRPGISLGRALRCASWWPDRPAPPARPHRACRRSGCGMPLVAHRPCQKRNADARHAGFGQCRRVRRFRPAFFRGHGKGFEPARRHIRIASRRFQAPPCRSARKSDPSSPARRRDRAQIESARRSLWRAQFRQAEAGLPVPTVPNVTGFVCAFSQAKSSAGVFGGSAFLVRTHNGDDVSSDIGCRSFRMS